MILAVDPGGTTGVACGRITFPPGKKWDYSYGSFEYVWDWQAELTEFALYGLLESIRPSYLVAETFEYRQQSRSGLVLTSRNLLGVCSLWAETSHSHFRLQSPAEGFAFYTNDKLREVGVVPSHIPHGRDAARHLLYFMAHKGGSKLISKQERRRLIVSN